MDVINFLRKKLDLQNFLSKVYSRLFGRIVDRWYSSRLEGLKPKEGLPSPIFIVGSPRSGTTILYQILVNQYDVLYINNLVHIFNRNLPFGISISTRLLGNNPHNYFKSRFGKTFKGGWRSPSECRHFWEIFPVFESVAESMAQVAAFYQQQVYGAIQLHKKPFIFKNLTVSSHITRIKEIFPTAKFIYIQRDSRFTVQSILQARKTLGVPAEKVWSVKPQNEENLDYNDEVSLVVSQVYYLEQEIQAALQLIPQEQVFRVSYEEFCRNVDGRLKELSQFMGKDIKERNGALLPALKPTQKDRLKGDALEYLIKTLNRYNWKNLHE